MCPLPCGIHKSLEHKTTHDGKAANLKSFPLADKFYRMENLYRRTYRQTYRLKDSSKTYSLYSLSAGA